jgi:putative ABC transport system permease protein
VSIASLRAALQGTTDTLRSALRSLGANKLRSALTLLGIIIGIVAVVAMAATTEGLRRRISQDLEMLGSGVFQVQKWPQGFGNRNWAMYEKRKNLTLTEVALLRSTCQQCLRVAGECWSGGQRISTAERSANTPVMVAGGTTGFFENNGYALATGRLFEEGEVGRAADVAVIGSDVIDALFPHEDPLGKRMRVQNRSYTVVGTLTRRGSMLGGGSLDSLVVLPISTFLPLYGKGQSLNITIQVRDPQRMAQSQDEVVSILRRARGVAPEAENDFEMFSNESQQEQFNEMSGSIAAASIGICAISLLIGGIGVMNIMLVSVTERTAEIGIRRALGARRRRILGQFVIEAITLTTFGGAFGVICGGGVAALVRVLVDLPTVVPAWAVTLAMLTSAATGLVFGIYPAYRASRLDPVEAMRHE